eukprot:XP_025013684.1 uncharacterized protein LOC8267205 [Ricinus communis]
MEGVLKKWLWVVCVAFLVLHGKIAAQQVPCYFIFGDSLVDNGNNNQLSSLARADYLPYGIDFAGGPSGRFSNGKTTVDEIAQLLGFRNYIPPYATARGRQILGGVNYASAAAGIREETGQQLGDRITFSGQVRNYRNTVSQIVNLLGGEDAAADYLKQCIFSIGLGSNDYLNNYFMPQFYSSSRQYTPVQYADVLIRQYTEQLTNLYNYGARKFALIGVGQIGCSPSELAQNSPDGRTCVQRINSANQIFNSRLRSLVDQFNGNTPDARFIYINAYGIFQDLINNPSRYGFRVTNAGCCGVGRNNGQITCLPFQTPCQNRNQYLFWDAFHPTEAANVIIGRRSYSAQSGSDAYPFDIRRLAQVRLFSPYSVFFFFFFHSNACIVIFFSKYFSSVMARQSQVCWLVFVVLIFLNLSISCINAQQVPCYFIFGDSFAANGNDNDLDTFKANYLPYGIDFPDGSTGRFSNGKTMVDIIAEKIGFKDYIPPFKKVGNGSEILKGANYASAGAIVQADIAGSEVTAISLSQQVRNHQKVVRRINNLLGNKNKTRKYLQKCLYSVGIGSNDYLLDYYTPQNNGSEPLRKSPSEAYAESLVDAHLFNRLNALYKAGARKIVLFGLPPLGCSPAAVRMYDTHQHCISVIDTDAHIFNSRLQILVDRLNKNYKNAQFTYINIYDITSARVFPGFKKNDVPCCDTDYNGMCYPKATRCKAPKEYFFWDGYRPTEAANIILGSLALNASVPSQAYPYNIQQLIAKTAKDTKNMVCETRRWWVVFLFVSVVSEKIDWADAEPEVPCFFIFGDSLADNGNNNNLNTLAKANYPPYGIDYADGPTGRFTNGRNTVDILADLLGFDHHIPPFATAKGQIILQGVNYASGSAGILQETGKHLGQNMDLDQQIKNHQITISRMISILGNNETAATKQLNRCIYGVGMGSNDYINNYFLPENYPTSKTFSLDSYAKALISQYSKQLMALYNQGARKIALAGLGNIGCIPHSTAIRRRNGSLCADIMNEAVHLFNNQLVSLVQQLNRNLSDAKFIYINSTSIAAGDPTTVGFRNLTSGCCEARQDGQCIENQAPCPDRRVFVFWDTFHPTEASNLFTAGRTYKSLNSSDCYPFDLHSLAQLDFVCCGNTRKYTSRGLIN